MNCQECYKKEIIVVDDWPHYICGVDGHALDDFQCKCVFEKEV